jgi:hypothetical protein
MLLDRRQCTLYALARFAGEPADAYPLWDSSMEMRMCCWTENIGATRLFASLLSVAAPERWDVPDSFKNLWVFKKKGFGRFRLLRKVEESAWVQRPRLRRLLAVAVCVRTLGYMNWLRVNNIVRPQLREQIYDQEAVPFLALLIALGVVEPTDHWQKPHMACREAEWLVTHVTQELHRTGRIRWKDGVGADLISRLEQAHQRRDLGWVDERSLMKLVRTLSGEEAESECEAPAGEALEQTACARGPVQLRLPFGSA